jgi:sulfite exporter TauE/SafE
VHFHTHGHKHGHDRENAHHHTHAAFGIGTLHGLAGSSHFLGVLPALAFPTKLQAASYLLAFGIGTVAAMAAFSWGMGVIATRFKMHGAKLYRNLLGACAAAAMGVGCFWLASSWH